MKENVYTLAMRGDGLCQIIAEEVEPGCNMPIVRSFEFARRARPDGTLQPQDRIAVGCCDKVSKLIREEAKFARQRAIPIAFQPEDARFRQRTLGRDRPLNVRIGFKITDRTFIASRPDTPSIIPATLFSAQSVSIRMTNSRICLLAASSPIISPSRSRLPWSKTGFPSGWCRVSAVL